MNVVEFLSPWDCVVSVNFQNAVFFPADALKVLFSGNYRSLLWPNTLWLCQPMRYVMM